jgi:hypothetical protein
MPTAQDVDLLWQAFMVNLSNHEGVRTNVGAALHGSTG